MVSVHKLQIMAGMKEDLENGQLLMKLQMFGVKCLE